MFPCHHRGAWFWLTARLTGLWVKLLDRNWSSLSHLEKASISIHIHLQHELFNLPSLLSSGHKRQSPELEHHLQPFTSVCMSYDVQDRTQRKSISHFGDLLNKPVTGFNIVKIRLKFCSFLPQCLSGGKCVHNQWRVWGT